VLTMEQARHAIGATAYTSAGERIGKVGQLYVDDATEQPEWITVSTGLFGTKQSFVPLAEAQVEGDKVTVPYSKEQVKEAPRVDPDDGHLSDGEETELYRHYGLPESGPPLGTPGVGFDTDRPTGGGPGDRATTGTSGTVQGGTGYAAGTSGTMGSEPGFVSPERPTYQETSEVSGYPGATDADEQGHVAHSDEQVQANAEERRTGRARLRRYEVGEDGGTRPVS
jgi:sporulation protein YlmC with PRC-barrel domain